MENNKNKIMDIVKIVVSIIDNPWQSSKSKAFEILSLLGENTASVSAASTESGVLHGVGESHASETTNNDSLADGELPLEKIDYDGNNFYCEFGSDICSRQCDSCRLDDQYLG